MLIVIVLLLLLILPLLRSRRFVSLRSIRPLPVRSCQDTQSSLCECQKRIRFCVFLRFPLSHCGYFTRRCRKQSRSVADEVADRDHRRIPKCDSTRTDKRVQQSPCGTVTLRCYQRGANAAGGSNKPEMQSMPQPLVVPIAYDAEMKTSQFFSSGLVGRQSPSGSRAILKQRRARLNSRRLLLAANHHVYHQSTSEADSSRHPRRRLVLHLRHTKPRAASQRTAANSLQSQSQKSQWQSTHRNHADWIVLNSASVNKRLPCTS